MLYQHITAYSSAVKFTFLIPGNVCVQAEGLVKPINHILEPKKNLVLIQHHVEKNPIKE